MSTVNSYSVPGYLSPSIHHFSSHLFWLQIVGFLIIVVACDVQNLKKGVDLSTLYHKHLIALERIFVNYFKTNTTF